MESHGAVGEGAKLGLCSNEDDNSGFYLVPILVFHAKVISTG